jgi:RsiW-degrading membrane proteinase PrsW (M82 family)
VSRVLGLARVAVLLGGLCLAVAGLLIGCLGAGLALVSPPESRLAIVTLGVSVAALGAGLGIPLAWQAWSSVRGLPSRPFEPRGLGLGIALFVLALGLGQVVVDRPPLNLVLFPPLHVAAAALPPLLILASVGRSLRGATRWRDAVLQDSSGAVLSVSLAMMLELALLVGLVVALVAAASQAGVTAEIESLATNLQDPAELARLAQSPLVWAIALLVASVAVPLIEEAVKTVGVGLLSYRRPSLAEAFVWGVAGGAGFAMTEAALYGAAGLAAWAPLLVLRVGATLMHCLTGALMGIAWYSALHRRWLRGLGLYGVAVGLHAAWNALSISQSLLSLQGENGPGGAIVAVLGLMAVGAALGLVALTRSLRARRRDLTSAEAGPEAV